MRLSWSVKIAGIVTMTICACTRSQPNPPAASRVEPTGVEPKRPGPTPPMVASSAVALPANLDSCDCPIAEPCPVAARRPGSSQWARERGIIQGSSGVECDPERLNCAWKGSPTSVAITEVRDCGLWLDMLVTDGKHAYVVYPQSIGVNGGPGYVLSVVEGANPATFRPLSKGFARDDEHLFDHGTLVPGVNPSQFRLLLCDGRCEGCDEERCLVQCHGHPLSHERFCWEPARERKPL